MSDVEDEIRTSLIADLSLSHVFHHDAEYEADDLLRRLKSEWTHEMAEKIRERAAEIVGLGPYSLGILSVIDMVREKLNEENQ